MASLPEKFWINADSGRIIAVGYLHGLTILQSPQYFDLPKGLKGTKFADSANRVRMGTATEDDMYNPELLGLVFERGWVRADASSSDALSVETPFIRDAAKAVQFLLDAGYWFTDLFLDFIYSEQNRGSVHLDDGEQIERFAKTGNLPPRFKDISMNKRRTGAPVVAKAPKNIARELTARMESMKSLIEARRTTTKDRTSNLNFADPSSQGDLSIPNQTASKIQNAQRRSSRIPGRQARPGEASHIRTPANHAAMAAFSDLTKDLGADDVSDAQARINAGIDDTPRLTGPDRSGQELVPLNQLPALVDQETGQEANITWHKVSSLPNYVVNQIRVAFRPLFRGMLNAELEEISVASTLPGAGTQPSDLEALWNFLMSRGDVNDNFSLEAFGIDPNVYHVDQSHVVDFGGHKFYLMNEKHGHMGEFKYIYVAPGKAQNKVQIETGQQKLLR